jgi:hypothetical protein
VASGGGGDGHSAAGSVRLRRHGPSAITPKIAAAVAEISGQFADDAHYRSNTARAMNLYIAAEVSEAHFVQACYEAASITRDEMNRRRLSDSGVPVAHGIRYFFAVLRDRLAPHGGAPAAQHSDDQAPSPARRRDVPEVPDVPAEVRAGRRP